MNQIAVVGIICALFSFVDAQGLTITTPNGSEEYIIGNKHPIHWNWSGSISSVKLEYSLDGSINWTLIASSTANDGDYLWTIPDTTSSNCFIRISDVADPMTYDLSDGSFSILRQSIDIKKPDGGEILVIGETCPIHWDWTGKFNDVKIEYSTDAGGTWVSITGSTPNDGSYNWAIPNIPSPTCLIKVTNKDDLDCSNTSDAFFSIALNTISIIQPDGGEAYTIGENYPIYWDWTGSFNDVKIQYSTDAGGTWILITNSTSNDGSYNWMVPNTPSNNCRVKITNTIDPNCLDTSSANFTILATSLQLTAPNGGENYRVGDICPIHWDWSGTIGTVKLEYSADGGVTWYSITTSTGNDGDYDWTIPNIPTTQCRTKITNLADPNCWDVSNTNFTVQRPAFIIFDPDSGKELVAGEIYPIHWNWLGTVSSVKLELWYKTESGVEWWTVTSNTANDGSHDITMPYFISDSCGIKLTSNDDLSCFTLSEVFKITRPTITIVYPFGGVHLIEGEDFEIIWNWNGNFSSAMLQYSNDLGANWQTITVNTSNDGSYAWEVPTGVWSSYLLKVINTADIDCYDVSDIFNVDKDTISVIRPAASDTFFIKRKHPIYWRTTDDFHSVRIDYLTDAWRTITPATDNMGYYIWTCDTFKSSNARIAVTSNLNTGTSGLSGSFIIADTTSLISNSLRILAPVSGDTFAIGGKCCITWHSVNFAPPNNVILTYSIDNGPWVTIATVSNNDKSYLWTVPNYATNNCRISVSDVNGSASDISESFSIALQGIEIVSPTSEKEWIVGRKYYILWNWTGAFSNAVIDYSYNGGAEWVNIASPTGNDGEYEWTIPNAPSTQCLIRIRNYENPGVIGISDTFAIVPQTILVTYPIASDDFLVGRKYFITWDYTGAFPSANIEYSVDGGTNWTSVALSVGNNQKYEWTIPNTPTDLAVVRVINSANLNVYALSDTFSITPQMIVITSPTVDDQWIIGRKYFITWRYTGVFPNVKIEYSYDNGLFWNIIAANTANSRTYEWTVPNTPSDSCRVKVSNYNNLNVLDVSDLFRIPLQALYITSPQAGDNLISGRKYYITWRWLGSFPNVNIQYSTNNGTSWNTIQSNATNNGNYEWTIPTASSDSCLIKLTNPQNPNVYCVSDIFSILPQEITITTPAFSDTFIAGRKYYITWRTRGFFTNANISYSLDGGQNWVEIANNVANNGCYEWLLPEVFSNIAQIRIANNAQVSVYSLSDTFDLASPILEITSPNHADLWYTARKYYITWNCLGGIQNIDLYYSLNGGINWEVIADNQANQGNYEWTIPSGIASPNSCVKLASNANAAIYYISDSFGLTVGIEEDLRNQLPTVFALQGFTPNPFSDIGNIRLAIPTNALIKLYLYDICGRLVNTVFEGTMEPGFYSLNLRNNIPCGVYFLKFEALKNDEKVYNCVIKILKI